MGTRGRGQAIQVSPIGLKQKVQSFICSPTGLEVSEDALGCHGYAWHQLVVGGNSCLFPNQ